MKILLHPVHAAPALRSMPPDTRRRMKRALGALAEDPSGRTAKLDVKRLEADLNFACYRLRLGDWRVAFTVDRDVVVLRVFHRREGYGWLAELDP